MTIQDVNFIKESLSVLVGQPMRNLGRAGAMIVANFGELVETNIAARNENGEFVRDENGIRIQIRGLDGRHAINVLCKARFTCGDEVIFGSSDIFLPSTKIISRTNFNWQTFNWSIEGNNSFDEKLARHFMGEFSEYVVKDVKVSKFGDLTILFKNDFGLELFSNYSRDGENWCLYDVDTNNALSVLGNGIEERLG